MAKKKRKKSRGTRIPRGAKGLALTPGKCKVVKGRIKVCVAKNGAVTVTGATLKRVGRKKSTAKSRKKAAAPKGALQPKAARKTPRTKKSLNKRLRQCKSPLFNKTAGKTPKCSCVIINSKGNPQVVPLSRSVCVGSKPSRTGKRVLRDFRAGGFRKSFGRQPKAKEVIPMTPGSPAYQQPLSGIRRRRRRPRR